MIDKEAIEKIIADAVELTLVTGTEVIIAEQDAPRPDGSYATVKVSPSFKKGFDRVTLANDAGRDLDETLDGHRELTASINWFRTDAFKNASSFVQRLQGNALIELFKTNGLGFAGNSDVRDISEVIKNIWEERAQIDLTFFAISNFTETVLAIESVDIDGEAQSGNTTHEININII